jgi:hypothetical protein
MGDEWRSQFDVGKYAIGFVGGEMRSQFGVGNMRSHLWVVRCDRCLMSRFRRSGVDRW